MSLRSSKSSHFLRPRPARSDKTDPVPAHARNTAEEYSPEEIEAAIALMTLANSTQELPTSKSQMNPTIGVVDSRDKGKPAEKDSSTSPVEQDMDPLSDTPSPRGPKNASLKRPLTSQVKKPRKRAKTEREATPAASDDADISLPFHSIRAINVPVRHDAGPPRPKSFPYGCLADHQDSMLIYWLDEEGRTYQEATELWAEKFPRNKLGFPSIRRRHIRILKRLANEYGVKTWEQIDAEGPVWENTKRRGKKQNKPVPTPTFQEEQGTDELKSVLEGHKTIERTAIVVWKDLEGLDFEQIQKRLNEQYDWPISSSSVEKYYYLSRGKIQGAYSKAKPPVEARKA